MAGRLKGTAFQFAMLLTYSRLDRINNVYNIIPAPELFALEREEAVVDANTGQILVPVELSGAQYLVAALEKEFSPSAQDLQWQTMLSFFDMYRGGQTYEEYQAMHDLAWQDLVSQSGITMNEVGRTFFLLRGAQLTDKQLFDLRLRVDGDLSRATEVRTLLARMFTDTSKIRNATVPSMTGQYFQDTGGDFDHSTWWADDSFYDVWYECDDSWYDDAWRECEAPAEDEAFWGKGKSSLGITKKAGDGCSTCGSKFHAESDCPIKDGGSSSHSAPPSHGSHKGSGKSYSKGKGKSKGKGDYFGFQKGKYKKGKGKSKGKYKSKYRPSYYKGGKGKKGGGKGKGKSSPIFMLEDGPAYTWQAEDSWQDWHDDDWPTDEVWDDYWYDNGWHDDGSGYEAWTAESDGATEQPPPNVLFASDFDGPPQRPPAAPTVVAPFVAPNNSSSFFSSGNRATHTHHHPQAPTAWLVQHLQQQSSSR